MENSQDVRHRSRDDVAATTTGVDDPVETKGSRDRKLAMAKGGLKSLSIAVGIPFALTVANIYLFGTSAAYRATGKHSSWVPPLWALHATCLGSAILMGVSGWMFWAQGGLRRCPNAAGVYVAQLALSLAWDPLVFRAGTNWAALLVAGAVFALAWRCGRLFREVSPIAGDLVKPCLAWAAFLAFVNLKLMLSTSPGSA